MHSAASCTHGSQSISPSLIDIGMQSFALFARTHRTTIYRFQFGALHSENSHDIVLLAAPDADLICLLKAPRSEQNPVTGLQFRRMCRRSMTGTVHIPY